MASAERTWHGPPTIRQVGRFLGCPPVPPPTALPSELGRDFSMQAPAPSSMALLPRPGKAEGPGALRVCSQGLPAVPRCPRWLAPGQACAGCQGHGDESDCPALPFGRAPR